VSVELLIHAIVRQTMVLIAQLATSQGIRAPLPHIADQVFAELVSELDRQGVSRHVSADMFGMALRTYRRKVQRLRESSTLRGRSLWESVFAFIKETGLSERSQIVAHFFKDDEEQVRAVLTDLCVSRLVMSSGAGARTIYRATTAEETWGPARSTDESVDDDLVIALMYREGPLTVQQVASMIHEEPAKTQTRLTRLVADGRIQVVGDADEPTFKAEVLLIPLGAEAGWEGAVFDHFKALVSTVLLRLSDNQRTSPKDCVGGSTYTLEVWPGHPLEDEVLGTLQRLRGELSDMRHRVVNDGSAQERPRHRQRVTIYLGQNVIADEDDNNE